MRQLETVRIIERYQRREQHKFSDDNKKNLIFENYRNKEREREFFKLIISKYGDNIAALKVLEIGAGDGVNLHFFKRIGVLSSNIWANELLKNRVDNLKKNFPDINIISGNAMDIRFKNKFDIILQSMVFSSILDTDFRISLAVKMIKILKENGMILWYDLAYDNPWNKDVTGINRNDIKKLFPDTQQKFKRITLVPQLARIAGHLYNIINCSCPFLRSHIVAGINLQ